MKCVAVFNIINIYGHKADSMPYDEQHVDIPRMLDQLATLGAGADPNAAAVTTRKKLTAAERCAEGAKVVMRIGRHVKNLQPHVAYIDARKVDRPDLAKKLKSTNVTGGCTYYLKSLGFEFVDKKMQGEIGYLVRTKSTDNAGLCQLFIGILKANCTNIRAWTNALNGGFKELPKMIPMEIAEKNEVEAIMKTAVNRILIDVEKFMHLFDIIDT